jgi:hypothetical protein
MEIRIKMKKKMMNLKNNNKKIYDIISNHLFLVLLILIDLEIGLSFPFNLDLEYTLCLVCNVLILKTYTNY